MIGGAGAPPGWESITDSAAQITTVVAAIAAGIFAYYKFARGRIFRVRCGVEALAQMKTIGNQKCANVTVVFTNQGQASFSLYRDVEAHNRVIIHELNELMLDDADASSDDVVWEGGTSRQATLFRSLTREDPVVIESGEKLTTSVLVPLSADAIGFRVIAILQVRSRSGRIATKSTVWAESVALLE